MLRDGERAGVEIDVVPSQSGQLASTHTGVQRNGERGLCFLLRPEPTDLAPASFADVIEAEVEAILPRPTVGSRRAGPSLEPGAGIELATS